MADYTKPVQKNKQTKEFGIASLAENPNRHIDQDVLSVMISHNMTRLSAED